MDMKTLLDEITHNFDELDLGLSRMDLTPLPAVMQHRSRLIALFAELIEASAPCDATTRDAVYAVKDQNFRLESRITNYLACTPTELERLFDESRHAHADAGADGRGGTPGHYC